MSIKVLATNASWNALAGMFAQGTAFVSGVLVARLLGPEATGIIAIVLWVGGTFVVLTSMGLPAALNRFLPDLQARGATQDAEALSHALYKRTVLVQITAGAIALAIAIWAGTLGSRTGSFGRLLSDPLALAITCAFCIALGLQTFLQAFWSGNHRFALTAKTAALSAACQLFVTASGAILYGVDGALVGYVAGAAPAALLSLQLMRRSRVDAAPELLRQSAAFARTMWLTGMIASVVWVRTELLFLGVYADLRDVGYFTVANTLANVAVQIPTMMAAVLFPYLASRRGVGPLEDIFQKYAAALKLFAFFIFPISLGIAALAPALISSLFGKAFAPASATATVLVAASGFAAAASIGSMLLYVADRSHVVLRTDVAGAVAFVAAGLTLIPAFGIIGAAWTRVVVQAGIIAAQAWYIHSVLGCRLPLGSLLRIVLAATATALVARLVLDTVDGGLVGMAIAVPVGALTYYGAISLLGALEPDDIDRLRNLCRMVPGRGGRFFEMLTGALRADTRFAK
jgi:O-antigen/teichoic acid export membrane protein